MKTIQLVLAAVLSLGAVHAVARSPVPVVNHDMVAVQSASGKALSAGQVKQAIVAAAGATGRKWTVSEVAPGHLVATYMVRTHTVVTDIKYSGSSFSIAYKDSVNMKFSADGAGGNIHPFYNQWVSELVQAIRMELGKA